MKNKYCIIAVIALFFAFFSCGSGSRNVDQNKSIVENHDSTFIKLAKELLVYYLDVDLETRAKLNVDGSKLMKDLPDEYKDGEISTSSVREIMIQAKDLLEELCELLDQGKWGEFHDRLYDERNSIFSSPVNMLNDEKDMIGLMQLACKKAYPMDQARKKRELMDLLSWRMNHIRLAEMVKDGHWIEEGERWLHDDHFPTAIELIDCFVYLEKWEELIREAEMCMSEFAQFDFQEGKTIRAILVPLVLAYQKTGDRVEAERLQKFLDDNSDILDENTRMD